MRKLWRKSQTIALSYVQLGSSGALAIISGVNSAVADPSVKQYLDKLDLPKSVIIGLAVLGILTYLAHGHTDA